MINQLEEPLAFAFAALALSYFLGGLDFLIRRCTNNENGLISLVYDQASNLTLFARRSDNQEANRPLERIALENP